MTPTLPHARINYRVFSVLSLVALPLLAIGAIVVLGIGQAQLRDTYNVHLARMAERTAAAVDGFVFRRIIDVSSLARVLEVRDTAAAGSRQDIPPSAVRRIDEDWQRQRKPPQEVAGVLDNAASRFFRDVVQNDTLYSELILADRAGRLVAASNVTSDYLQADEDWWGEVVDTRRVHISDVYWDESAQIHAIEISVPVFATGSDELAGVLKAATNAREMLAPVSGLQLGETGEAALVRKDGLLVFSRRAVQPGTEFFAGALLREALGLTGPPAQETTRLPTDRATDPQFRAFFSAQSPEAGRMMVAVAPTQLGISYPSLPWLVAVHQAEDELFAPVRSQVMYFLLLLALVTVAVLGFALWFSMQLRAHPIDTDMHLVEHPSVHRIDEDEEDQEEAALPAPGLPTVQHGK